MCSLVLITSPTEKYVLMVVICFVFENLVNLQM